MKKRVRMLALAAAVLLAAPMIAAAQAVPPPPGNEKVARLVYQPLALAWEPQLAYRSASLRVVGPGGYQFEREFGAGRPSFALPTDPPLADGRYTYELVLGRTPDAALEKAIERANVDTAGNITDTGIRSRIAALRETVSGTFSIVGGRITTPYQIEARVAENGKYVAKDIVQADDLIVRGGLCVGIPCADGEPFVFDTIRVKSQNARIQFTDTSTSIGFPSNNWQIRANDSASGGASYLAFVDQGPDGQEETGNIVFSVAAGAPANSLFVGSAGDVGIRTATPAADLHMRTGDTPTMRLEQDTSGLWPAHTWDVAGNESLFFVRDVTSGNILPFTIYPGARSDSLTIGTAGVVAVGSQPTFTAEPSSRYLFVGGRFNIGTSASAGAQYVQLSNNAIYDGASPRYLTVGPANQVYMNGDTTVFRRAASGIPGTVVPWVESLRIDSAGRVGVGGGTVAAEPGSPYLFVGSRFSIGTSAGSGAQYVQLSNNAVYNGTNPVYVGTGGASQMYMNGDSIVFRRAASGTAGSIVPWTEHLRIDSAGVRVSGDLHVTGACCGADYVFDPSFKLASIEENGAYMWKHRHLPALQPAKTTTDGRAEIDVFAQSNGMLEELEKAHIYIQQLQDQITTLRSALESRDARIERELEEIRGGIARP